MRTPSISPQTIHLTTAALATLAGAAAPAVAQWAPPFWTAERIGLYDGPEFTAPDGTQISQLRNHTGPTRFTGYSDRFVAGAPAGRAAWTWAPGETTQRLGFLADPLYTSSTGAQLSDISYVSAPGRVAGFSRMYSSASPIGNATWTWDPVGGHVATGLLGAAFTGAEGRRGDITDGINADGRIIGRSTFLHGTPFSSGQASWTWHPTTGSIRTGIFSGPEFTRADGTQNSTNRFLNNAGRIVGTSDRYAASDNIGAALWTWDAVAGTTRIGLFADPEFTRADGHQFSNATLMNQAGRITGTSSRANGGPTLLGEAAWTWSPGAGTVRIGLHSGPEFTGSDGSQSSSVAVLTAAGPGLTESGWVIGSSQRYNGGSPSRGFASWIWHESIGTVRTGFASGPEFTSSGGVQRSWNLSLNESGRLTGASERFSGAQSAGRAAWTWDAAAGTTRIGLISGPEFTSTAGVQNSEPTALSQAGRIIGWSERFSGADSAGRATWTWDVDSGTIRTGLHEGPEFTRADGYQHSNNRSLLQSGRITGTSERFSAGAAAGTAAWTWTPETGTVRIGLYDPTHTSDSGVITNAITAANQAGAIVGTAQRSGGGDPGSLGQSGWFFDPATDLTTELVFSADPIGRASTFPTILTSSGWVLGHYDLYDGASLLSENMFLWSLASGFTDLGGLIDGGLPAAGIQRLLDIVTLDEAGLILAHGLPLHAPDTTHALYALTIPTPPTTLLLPLALLATPHRRRRK